jgi:LAS superfamily LD-carboxypeptidase LdcB
MSRSVSAAIALLVAFISAQTKAWVWWAASSKRHASECEWAVPLHKRLRCCDCEHSWCADNSRSSLWPRHQLVGDFVPETAPQFRRLARELTVRDVPVYLRVAAAEAFQAMAIAARKEGIELRVLSGTRTFEQQKSIWNAVWNSERALNGKRIPGSESTLHRASKLLEWIAMPGTSRHHWGTDLDINAVDPCYFEYGRGKREFLWLSANAQRFGFCQPYGPMDRRLSGYREEKWHWSYMPLAQSMLEAFAEHGPHKALPEFLGSQALAHDEVLVRYVQAIDPSCHPVQSGPSLQTALQPSN